MKISPLCKTLAALLALSITAHASFQASYATINGTYYDLNASTANTDFQGANLGVFDTTTDSILLGAELNITGGNVEYANIGWGIYNSSNDLVAGFTETGGTYDSSPGGNDRWLVSGGARPDLLSGLGNGDYTVEVYLHGDYNGGDFQFYESNSSNNYVANFTVVPEPGTYAMFAGLLGLIYVALRHRRS